MPVFERFLSIWVLLCSIAGLGPTMIDDVQAGWAQAQLLGFFAATVLDLLDVLPPGPLAKKDGTLIIDAKGNRIV